MPAGTGVCVVKMSPAEHASLALAGDIDTDRPRQRLPAGHGVDFENRNLEFLHAKFGEFLRQHRIDDVSKPTQAAGTILFKGSE
jgi:hypothetical protein